jgi:hypothetical protein
MRTEMPQKVQANHLKRDAYLIPTVHAPAGL